MRCTSYRCLIPRIMCQSCWRHRRWRLRRRCWMNGFHGKERNHGLKEDNVGNNITTPEGELHSAEKVDIYCMKRIISWSSFPILPTLISRLQPWRLLRPEVVSMLIYSRSGTCLCLAFSSLSLRIIASRARSALAWSVLPDSCNFQYRSLAAVASNASLQVRRTSRRK
jgi:hypothetical protein